jgi:hypothetical protein
MVQLEQQEQVASYGKFKSNLNTKTMADTYTNPNANFFQPGQGGNPTTSAAPVTPINTAQPTPAIAITNTPTPTNTYTGNSIVDALKSSGQASDFASRAKLAAAQGITNYTGTADQNTQLLQKYQAGLAAAKSSNAPVPATSGDASAKIQDITKQSTADIQQQQAGADQAKAITDKMNNDPGFQQLQQDQKDYLSAQNQQQSLADEYAKLIAEAGIPALNTQLINMKSIMDGTEQDIRNEITKAGGFATESQVQALTVARNKTMIQNYNNLLQTRDDALSQINTTLGFEEKDRAAATALAQEKMQYDKQVSDYAQKMQTNAADAYNKIIATPGYGYKSLYASTGGDAHTISLIENTLGLSPGSLKTLSEQNTQKWSEPYSLGGNLVQKDNQTGEIRTAVANAGTGGGSGGADTVTLPGDPTSQSILANTGLSIPAFGYLTQGTSALTRMSAKERLQYMNEAQNWANKNGIDLATFQSQYEAYNTALQSNIKRVNNVKVAEGELTGTLANLAAAADEASFKNMKWENVAKLFAGQQFNDANVSKYAFHLNQLRSELALYNAAAAGKTTADQKDQDEAERIIKDGFAKGSITGFQSALKASVEKMDTVLQQNVERTNGQVWSLFGVTKPTVSLGSPKDSQTVEALLSKNGYNYNDLISKMMAPGAIPEGKYPAIDAVTGKPFAATKEEIKSGKYIAL